MKIYDCITFFNSNFLFETRVNVLNKYVDYFVVCEANKDHVGKIKNFNFNPKISEDIKKKIIYVKADDLPEIKLKGKKDYKLVELQMEKIHNGIRNADDNDLIIFSDEDEIPNPNQINYFNKDIFKFGIFLQNMYFYKINILSDDHGYGNWPGSRICKKKFLKSFFNLRLLKVKNINYPFWRIDKEKSIQLIKNGGWHFSYLMSPEDISKKITSAAHTEFNQEKYKSIKHIENSITNLKDPFERNINLKKVKIDNSYPDYIRNNLDLFKKWIID